MTLKCCQNKSYSSFPKDKMILFLYYMSYFVIGCSLLLKQPFGNPPDEYNRFLIPQYIFEHGTLPNGYDESIRIPGYGFSYAFQPILPYMIQGYAMRLASHFFVSTSNLLYVARFINLLFGFLAAFFVMQLSKEWFHKKSSRYLFAFLVTLLPQSIFVHTYVNTDSCCMLSIVLMLYGLTKGLKNNFQTNSSILLSVGIILCALSYYNAYGYILSAILLFTTHFISIQHKHLAFDWKQFLQKGLFISCFVLLGIGWWFIRSAILYNGDILGLKARDLCASLYAIPTFHPDTRMTLQTQGYSFLDLFFKTEFLTLSFLSFIGIYGPMTIITSIWVYRFYKLLFFLGIVSTLISGFCSRNATSSYKAPRPLFHLFFHMNMIFCILLPCFLSAYYSYTTDYQPQGRYILPMLFPFCFYCIKGIEKGWHSLSCLVSKKVGKHTIHFCYTNLCIILCILIILCLIITVYGYAFPYYIAHPIAD